MTILIYIITGVFFLSTIGAFIYLLYFYKDTKWKKESGLSSAIYKMKNHVSITYKVRAFTSTIIYWFFISVFWIAKLIQKIKSVLFFYRKYKGKPYNLHLPFLENAERDTIILLPLVTLFYGYLILSGVIDISINYLMIFGIYAYILSYIIHSVNLLDKIKRSPGNIYISYGVTVLCLGLSIAISYGIHLVYNGVSIQSIQSDFLQHLIQLFTLKPIRENIDAIREVKNLQDYIFTGCGYLYIVFIFKTLFKLKEFKRNIQERLTIVRAYFSLRDLKNAHKWLLKFEPSEKNLAYWSGMLVYNALSFNKVEALRNVELAWGAKKSQLRNIDLQYLALLLTLISHDADRKTILIYLNDWAAKSKLHIVLILGLLVVNRSLLKRKIKKIVFIEIEKENRASILNEKSIKISDIYKNGTIEAFDELQVKGHFESWAREMLKLQAYLIIYQQRKGKQFDADKSKFNYIISQLIHISRKVTNQYEIELIYIIVKVLIKNVHHIDEFMIKPLEILEKDLKEKIPKSAFDEIIA